MSKRRADVLCHVSCLPSDLDYGDLGSNTYKFIDFLSSSGFTVWQILPLCPTHPDLCPYQSLSAHAGNPQLINLEWLCDKGWLSIDEFHERHETTWTHRLQCLQHAYLGFKSDAGNDEILKFQTFIKKHNYWLENYALYMALHKKFENQSWVAWPESCRDRDAGVLQTLINHNQSSIEAIQFQQYVFFTQWAELKQYANDNGIFIIGDMPIFVSHDSVEVWANRKYFALDDAGYPEFVAGVPPDYFSSTGQRWGNPHYKWQQLETDGFSWWLDRIRTQYELYDAVRIDHFRGLVKYWEIPASEETAVNGRWVPAPGKHLLQALTKMLPDLYLIAEDLGTITPDVLELRDEFALPGMNVLQFAFDGSNENPYLPQNHKQHSLVYTATHDNDTTLAWYESLSYKTQQYVRRCINHETKKMPWPMIHAALDLVANLAIFPMQDLLSLGAGHRMNTPGTSKGNWRWRFKWNQIDPHLPVKFAGLLKKYNRAKKLGSEIYSFNQTMQPVSNG